MPPRIRPPHSLSGFALDESGTGSRSARIHGDVWRPAGERQDEEDKDRLCMNVEMTKELLRYNTWANERLLGALAHLDSAQFTRILGGSYPSVQATLIHIVWVEWLWVERWQGHSPMELFLPQDFPSVSHVAKRWIEIQATQQSFVQSLTPEDLQRVVRYTNRAGENWEYVVWRMIYHLVNHSTHHRGQLVNMMRLLDAQPATTDFLDWWDEGR